MDWSGFFGTVALILLLAALAWGGVVLLFMGLGFVLAVAAIIGLFISPWVVRGFIDGVREARRDHEDV